MAPSRRSGSNVLPEYCKCPAPSKSPPVLANERRCRVARRMAEDGCEFVSTAVAVAATYVQEMIQNVQDRSGSYPELTQNVALPGLHPGLAIDRKRELNPGLLKN